MSGINKYLLLITVSLLFGAVKAQTTGSHYSIVEVTGKVGQSLNPRPLLSIADKQRLSPAAVYQWNNHLIIYGNKLNLPALQKSAKSAYPGCEITVYKTPFYDFNRKQYCSHNSVAAQWDNIILTANLVKDVKLQHEYLNYHATQFQKWPEVANGFCNADFQQLLVFKNGRRLMLVISIPKGKILDELNPKTTENNPRVNEWNRIMKKYQEGISGTKPGEVWVFMKPVTK
jgi:hypothetical protein